MEITTQKRNLFSNEATTQQENIIQTEYLKTSLGLFCGQKSCDIPLHNFLVIVKDNNLEAENLSQKIKLWLKEHNRNVFLENAKISETEIRNIAEKVDIVLVLGGDGTMLGTARKLYGIGKPLLGINFGRVGFLTDICPKNWQSSLNALLTGLYEIQLYLPLYWELIRDNNIINKGFAINDVVIARGLVAKSIHIGIYIDDIFLSDLHCDGLICSTPLGATAYAASAHGPLVFPALDAHTLTPISPFAGSFPPLVLPKESIVKLQTRKMGETALTIDGQECCHVELNDTILVKTAKHRVPIFVQHPHWFWQRLTERGFIRPGPGTYT